MAFANSIQAQDVRIADRFSTILNTISVRFAQHRTYRTTIHELSNLTNRDLADLGLHRSMINAIAREAAYGK